MNNNQKQDDQLRRMKELMNYGLKESKQPEYSSVEHSKMAADGKLYGIVREGTNYYIKYAKNPKGSLISENFEYINGFRNRNDHKFDNFSAASRYLNEMMININESVGADQKRIIAESYIDEKKEVIEEQTRKVQAEIARQRQIMENTVRINEKKEQNCKQEFKPVMGKGADKNAEAPDCDAKSGECCKDYHGKNIKGGVGAPFTVKEASEHPLTSRKNPDYMDMSHGTKIGKNTGFGKPIAARTEGAVSEENGGEAESTESPNEVNEGTVMHTSQDVNSPEYGTHEKGDNAPFKNKANVSEATEDPDDVLNDEDDDLEGEDGFNSDDLADDALGDEGDEMPEEAPEEDDELEFEIEPDDDEDFDEEPGDVQSQLDAMNDKIDQILDFVQDSKYGDEPLYDDEDGEGEDDEMGEEPEDEPEKVVESRSYRKMRMMNEANRLNVFGKHPAYQKKVMSLPANNNFKRDGQYDMNDSSVDNESPYGISKGTQAPFDRPVETSEDAIVEAVIRVLKKKGL